MIILGLESTAHTFGAAILYDSQKRQRKGAKRVLSNVRRMATTEKGGLIPAKVAEHHEDVFDEVIKEAFEKASEAAGKKISWSHINLIAVSDAPGLGHALRVGVAVARTLALRHKKPLVGVNHCVAHLEVASLLGGKKYADPVLLYCSGANTQVIAYDGGTYRIFGETLDTGVGNFLDTFARLLGLGFPGGPKVEQLAAAVKSAERKELLELPYSVKGMDVSFSGILTSVERKHLGKKDDLGKKDEEKSSPERLAYSVQEVVFAMLVEVAERAMAHCDKELLVLGGGVACNKRLQEMCAEMCKARGARLVVPPNSLLVDNAAMIAWTGKLMYDAGVKHDPEALVMKPYERTDEVDVVWRENHMA